ncbi:MAG: dTDP-4-dehydrorhamnose reductase [Myxococcales bacterium]|nr:dTDP-4-dehydrorhamnose reductase [Myxococcales bacterium]MDH3482677.1 dTDP-4-dehydrorhamnose reductase [Myxococcales bacterium]
MPEFLVTGASGMLGRSWTRLLETRGIDHLGAPRAELDITKVDALKRWIVRGTKWVINCAAWTDVDGAESHPEDANAVNGLAVARLADRCVEVGAKLVHYSTDYVFDGKKRLPYRTEQARAPINAYGRSKALGEELLEQAGVNHLLVRSSWLYAPWGKNFVLTMRELVQTRSQLRVVDDQRGRPSSCHHIAEATLGLLENHCFGTYHVCDGGECTWFDLASLVRDVVNPDCVIEACASEEFPRPAPRPAYSVLDLTATEQVLGPISDWKGRVTRMLEDLEGIG